MKKSRNYEYEDMDERKQKKNHRKMIQRKQRHDNRKNLNEIVDSLNYGINDLEEFNEFEEEDNYE